MTSEEKAQRKDLRANQVEVQDTFRQPAFITLARLDASQEVQQLRQRMAEVNESVADELTRLKKIETYAKHAAEAADAIAKVAAKLAKIIV